MARRILVAVLLVALLAGGVLLAVRWLRPPPPNDRPPDDTGGPPVASLPDLGDEWPRFRGPGGQGVSVAGKPPVEWSDTKGLKWKAALPGPGASSPVVWGERVFVTCFTGHEPGGTLRRHVVCVNRADGKERWAKAIDAALPEDPYQGFLKEHGYASNTPVTDGERVHAFLGKSGLVTFDMDGKELWRADVGHRSSGRKWGSAASPILFGDLVIVNAGEEGRALFAFDRKTGKQAWKAEADATEFAFGTPVLAPLPGGKVEMVLAVPGQVWGLNPASGRTLWHSRIDLVNNISPSPVVIDGVAFITGGLPSRTVAVRGGEALWTSNEAAYVPSPVVTGGHLYLVTDTGTAVCLDAKTGEKVKQYRLPLRGIKGRAVYASPVLAGGRLYCVSRHSGTVVLEATPGMREIAVNKFESDPGPFNGSPAVSKGQLFLRSDTHLYCVE